jgi:glycosyltransferase involved in cell wall biosynthesis
MKVLYITTGDARYGASKSLLNLITNLRDHYGVVPVVLTKKTNDVNRFCDVRGIENHSLWYRDIMAGAAYGSRAMRMLKHLTKYVLYWMGSISRTGELDISSFDLIHTNHNRIDLGLRLSRKYHVPHVWHIREFGEADYNVVAYKKNYISYMNEGADRFIAISDAVKNCWIEKGIDPRKICRIYNGVANEAFIPRTQREDGFLRLVITGHVQPNKGQLIIVEAIGRLPVEIRRHVQLDIWGDAYADYKVMILKRIKALSLEANVQFKGYTASIPKVLSDYDVGIVASKSEGFGRVTVEYMLAGLVVLASHTGANPELLDNGKYGFLFRSEDVESLTETLLRIYHDKDSAMSVAEMGRRRALTTYSPDVCAQETYEVYRELLM